MNHPNGSADGYDDAELGAGGAVHQPEALQQLYARYSPAAYALAFRMLGNAAQAEECVQAAFLELWRQPQPEEPAHGEFHAWLLTTVHRIARARQRPAVPGALLPAARTGSQSDHPTAPAGPAHRRLAEKQQRARGTLGDPPPTERVVLEGAYFSNMTVAELAESLQEPLAATQARLHSGLQQLRAALAEAGPPLAPDAPAQPPRQRAAPTPPRTAVAAAPALAGAVGTEYRAVVRPVPAKLAAAGAASSTSESSELRRLAQQDQLLLLMAHELKTPITVIKGTIQLAKLRLSAGGHPEEARLLQVANQQVDRLTALIDYLLRDSLFNRGAMELRLARFNLADLVREVGAALQGLNPAHTVRVQAPADLVVEADIDRLEQVLTNLITNAIKYSPAGGAVEITLRCVGDEAEACVRDYGIGIPVADRDQVFERFQRAGNVGDLPGFGLGLAVSREIVQAHHGRIWVGDLAAADGADAGSPAIPAADERGSLLCLVLPLSQED